VSVIKFYEVFVLTVVGSLTIGRGFLKSWQRSQLEMRGMAVAGCKTDCERRTISMSVEME